MYPEKESFFNKIDPGWVIVFISCVLMVVLFVLVIELKPPQFTCEINNSLDQIFYPQEKGWLGGNVSASIQLYGKMNLWLFGETLLGSLEKQNNQTKRVITSTPHGSIALMNTTNNKPNYYIRTLADSDEVDPAGFFKPQDPSNYYTTTIGLVLPTNNSLVIFAIVHNEDSLLNGTDVIVVKNFVESPFDWKYTTSRIPQSSPTLQLSVAVAFNDDDDYIYIFGHDSSSIILSRITESKLSQLDWTALEFFGKSFTWSSSSGNLKGIINGAYVSGTLSYNSLLQSWYFLGLSSDGIVKLVTSSEMKGPWGSTDLYQVPASLFDRSLYITDSAKSHPEYQIKTGDIVFTFDTVPQSTELLDSNINAFRPTFVNCQINYY